MVVVTTQAEELPSHNLVLLFLVSKEELVTHRNDSFGSSSTECIRLIHLLILNIL